MADTQTYLLPNLLKKGTMMPKARAIDGVTCTPEDDGWYHVKGTATAGTGDGLAGYTWAGESKLTLPAGTYTLSCEYDGETARYISCSFGKSASTPFNHLHDLIKSKTITVSESFDFKMYFGTQKGVAVDARVRYTLVAGDVASAWSPAEGYSISASGGGALDA